MPTNFDFQAHIGPTLTDQIRLLPIYILQLVGAIGVFSFILIVIRDKTKNIAPSILYGVVFGVTGYLMTGLVAEFLGSQFKPYIRLELLFLVSMLGGWPAGLITGALTYLARLQFGGAQFWVLSGMETLIFIAAGSVLHPWSTRRHLLTVKLKDVLLITTFKTGVGVLSIYALHRGWPQWISEPTLLIFVTNRLVVFPIFFGMAYGMLMILKMDAQQQLHYRLQLEQMALRLQTAVQRELQLLAISHSLKTPLTRLRLRLELLDDEPLKADFDDDISTLDDMVDSSLTMLRSPDGQEAQVHGAGHWQLDGQRHSVWPAFDGAFAAGQQSGLTDDSRLWPRHCRSRHHHRVSTPSPLGICPADERQRHRPGTEHFAKCDPRPRRRHHPAQPS